MITHDQLITAFAEEFEVRDKRNQVVKRFRIISPDDGILDDAQHYGYRTEEKAWRAVKYKVRKRL
jgi:hypothetical protein